VGHPPLPRWSINPVNLPNSITLARIGCVPLFLWILSSPGFHALQGRQELPAAAVLLLALGSGAVDGYLARRTHRVTKLGTLLSALTDRLVVSTAFIALVRYAPALVPAWIAVLIVGREFLVTGLRAVAVQERMNLDVLDLGKGMTVAQTVPVLCLLLAHRWPRWQVGGATFSGTAIAVGVLWTMLAASLLSAAAYFRAFWVEASQQNRARQQAAAGCGRAEGR
jgi:CDP-diacylglycerol--glycerol-3-phosphate 3-phosphatidyltransferase